jgi:HEPN domain-containing protein
MKDNPEFADEIFGFHAQQAIEKSLKAWIATLNCDFPLTHNIITLLTLLEQQGREVQQFWDLVEYNSFAVQFRYEPFERLDVELNREEIVGRVTQVVEFISQKLRQPLKK